MRLEDIDFFKPGVVIAVLAFTDDKQSLLWMIAKLILVFYLVSFIKNTVFQIKREKKKEIKEPEDKEGNKVSSILATTPSYSKLERYQDPLDFLDMEKTRK